MSAPTARLPRTSARAVALAAVLGVLALTAHEPRVGLGVLSGGAVAAAVAVSTGGHSPALAAALFPAGVLGTVGVLVFASGVGPVALVLVAVAVPLGVGVSVVVLGGGSPAQLREVGTASLYAAVVAACGTALAAGVALAGSPAAAVSALIWATGRGAFGLATAVAVAGLAVSAGVTAIPPAALAPPQSRERAVEMRTAAAWAVIVGSLVVVALLAVLLVVAPLESTAGAVVDWLLVTPYIRGVLLGLAAMGVGLASVSLLARWSWENAPRPPEPVFSMVGGTVCGFVAISALLVLVGGPQPASEWTGIFAVAAVLFGVAWVVLSEYADALETGIAPAARTVVAVALGASGAIVGTTAAYQGEAAGTSVAGLAPLVAFAAGFFVYRAGRFGRTLGAEVGTAGAARRTQLVRLGWLGTVTALGLVVAAGGLWAATVLAPTLSVPAATGVVVGMVALVAGVWLLLR
jgi:hypothetical protein